MKQPDDVLPKWSIRFLNAVCPDYLAEEIEGDLLQKYQFDIERYGARKARKKLVWNILSFSHPSILLRNTISFRTTQTIMLKNYFITALRASQRQKLYSLINVAGLSVGLASVLLIGIYIADEARYDRHIPDAERIYRVGINETFKGDEILYSSTSAPLAAAMQAEMPDVEAVVRVADIDNPVRYHDKAFIEKRFLVADSNFFEFFGQDLIEGNAKECLKGPQKIVLSRSAAEKYFGYKGSGESPVGKQLIVGRDAKLTEVTGIFEDVPAATHMKYDMVLSMESIPFATNECWGCYGAKTYFKTYHQKGTEEIDRKLDVFAQQRIVPGIEKDLGISHDQFVRSGDHVSFFIQPLLSIHLQSNLTNEFEANGDIRYVYIFGITAIFLTVIACINFMNLATARAVSRAKEVGVRKTMGATRHGLIPQFLMESLLYVFVAGVLAVILTYIALGPFNDLTGKTLRLDLLSNRYVVPSLIVFLVVVALLAGTYPAFHLTAFSPAKVLKGNSLHSRERSFLRSTLVVVQFTISMALIVGTMIIYKQVRFIRDHNLGFDKENILRIPQTYVLGDHCLTFKDELMKHAGFANASFAQALPPNILSTVFLKVKGSQQLVGTYLCAADQDLVATMGYEMKSGRYFSRDFLSDSSAVVINEACAKLLGVEDHEGKQVGFADDDMYTVIGIMKDFNFESLKSEVQPLAIFLNPEVNRTLAVRLTPGDMQEKIAFAEATWKKYANGQPFEYSFVDEDFDSLFRAEQRLGTVFAAFTVLAILIACLGLFGLITYTAAQRTKEIGIRKILGATAGQVAVLLLSDLVRLVLISFVIAIPLAWYGMEQWLQSFAYRTDFDLFSVLIAGACGLLIAVGAVGYRSFKAASVNPVESLKNE
ncbi:ABC transporter permease [Dawidia soli]|uniref:ABC transporter permease n=1 Tax=Dawidia soli TaxID=2782352 RepID=A0AAP2GBC8_9BACT|nr:ABC transporter permease [Dawidia soli]MBT1684979.1 ABC transporter permease [Dawidia soli]